MFDDPEFYSSFSEAHQGEVKYSLSKIRDRLSWKEGENVLDVGCGTGDSTHNVLLPLLQPHCSQLIGVDMNPKMIDFAQSRWSNSNLSFKMFNIETEEDPLNAFNEDIRQTGGFDKIFSFFCLHWVKDRKRATENLSRLLKPGGQGFVHVATRNPLFKVWDELVVSEKWSPYFKTVKVPINEYAYIDNCSEVLAKALTSAGLTVDECILEERNNIFMPKSKKHEDLMLRTKTVDPLLSHIPQDKKQEYLTDLVKRALAASAVDTFPNYTSLMILFSKKA